MVKSHSSAGGIGAGPVYPFEVTHRMVMAIAFPMTLAFMTTPLLGIVDMGVVGRLADPALLAGLAAGALVVDICFASFNFLRSGTTGLVAQAFGRKDRREEQAVLYRALIIALASGLVLTMLAWLAGWLGAKFIDPAPDVAAAMRTYVAIRFYGAPVTLANYALLGYFLGRGEAGLGLLIQLFLNSVHIVLSVLLGLVLGWNLEGVAWGTVGGELAGLVLGLVIVARRFRRLPPLAWSHVLDRASILQMLAINRDIMVRTFALLGAFAFFTRQGASFGTVTMAANAVLMNFFFLAGYFLDGLANAAEQIVGRALGARYRPAFIRGIALSTLWAYVLALAAALVFLFLGGGLVDLISVSPPVREEAHRFLPWAASIAVSGVLAFQMDGVFIGATWSKAMRDLMLLALAIYLVAMFSLVPLFGNHGLWAALHILLLARGLTLMAVLPRKIRETFPVAGGSS